MPARGARIHAEVLGYSLNNDAHMTAPSPTGDSCIRAMRDALADAQLVPEQIDYINAHASSTQLNDGAETMSIKQVFGEHAQRIPVSGTKAITPIHSARPARLRLRFVHLPWIGSGFRQRSTIRIPIRLATSMSFQIMDAKQN
jgi:hypothetical protein